MTSIIIKFRNWLIKIMEEFSNLEMYKKYFYYSLFSFIGVIVSYFFSIFYFVLDKMPMSLLCVISFSSFMLLLMSNSTKYNMFKTIQVLDINLHALNDRGDKTDKSIIDIQHNGEKK